MRAKEKKNKMVGGKEYAEEMYKDEPKITLSEKMLKDGQIDGYDVMESVKRLIEELDNYEKIEGFDQVISREKFKQFIKEEFGDKFV